MSLPVFAATNLSAGLKNKKGRHEVSFVRPELLRQKAWWAYLLNPTLLGGVVVFGLLAHAPKLKAAVAIAIAAKILTNFIYTLPPFFAGCIASH